MEKIYPFRQPETILLTKTNLLRLCCFAIALTNCEGLARNKAKEQPLPAEITQTLAQSPWLLSLQLLPKSQDSISARSASTPLPSLAGRSAFIALKLRIQSQDSQLSLEKLFQEKSGQLSVEQQQNLLFYHMAEAGYLQIGADKIQPVAAYAEMTPQQGQYLDIVFTFSLRNAQIRAASKAMFVLDGAFFLEHPAVFSLPENQLLTAIN